MIVKHYIRYLFYTNQQFFYQRQMEKRRFCLSSLSLGKTGKMFDGFFDRFNGVFVDLTKENCHQESFVAKLKDSLDYWKNDNKRCIWFKVSTSNSHCVPLLVENGFDFHHARKEFVMMYKWLPEDNKPNLPPPCYTNLGVGAMVFNSKGQILAVSEANYDYPHWKLPGGYVEMGEDLVDAAVREVKEETGILSSFQSLVTFRHTHNTMFGNSDIYVLLMMKALTEDIQKADREVKDCKWMDVDEYTSHEHVHELNRLVVKKALHYKSKGIKLDIQKKVVKWAKYTRDMNFLILKECQY